MKFKCIYADPPWAYKVYSKKGQGRSAENHYRTMSKEDIYSLPVADIADDDCILFLWVTFPCLLEGLETIKRLVFVGLNGAKSKRINGSGVWGFGQEQTPKSAS